MPKESPQQNKLSKKKKIINN